MSGTAQGLEQHCQQVAESAATAIQWLRAVSARISRPTDDAERELRDIGSRAAKLRSMVSGPLNVGLIGSNLSGKSYLAGALARRGATSPKIILGEERVDYFARINPQRIPKGSACVTRFSLRTPQTVPADLPVNLRLLSQADVILIVANSYLEDVDASASAPATAGRLGAILNRLRGQMGEALPGMTTEDVGGMEGYFTRYFVAHPVAQALGPDFWRQAAELAPRLPAQGRAVMFSVLWGETPQLTVMCVRLLQALDALGNAEQAFCGVEALDVHSHSILDVETIMMGLEDETTPKVALGLAGGQRVQMPRPLAAALVAELYLPLEEQSFGFLGNADLLDFPGAPARSHFTEPDSLFADPTNRARHFRRGKAAYLFQRYVANQELAALVLCMEDTPPTARTLPDMVRDWIETAQGATADERRDMPCGLFVALTKFDQDLKEELRQKEDDPEHWARRLHSVFNEFLCRENRWSERWAPGRPFNNVFWLRNPVIPEPEVLQYNAAGRETGLVDRGRIARLRGRFIATPMVKEHFADPGRAWDEVLKLNDGGVSYLAGQLRPICDPEQRRRQVAELLAIMAKDMHQCLEPFYVAVSPPKPAPAAAEPAPQAEAEPVAVAAEASVSATEQVDARTTPPAISAPAVSAPAMPTPTPTPGRPAAAPADPATPAGEMPAAEPASPGGGLNVKLLVIAAVVALAVIGGAVALFSGGGGQTPPPQAQATQGPVQSTQQAARAPSAPVAAPAPAPTPPAPVAQAPVAPPPAPPAETRCGPIAAPERLGALPADAQISPADMVCVAKAWIAVGRAGDAVFQLTRAMQVSPNRAYGPASLELARLYDPLRANPNWPPNAAFAMEKYQDAINDANFPDTQREAQAGLDALKKAPAR